MSPVWNMSMPETADMHTHEILCPHYDTANTTMKWNPSDTEKTFYGNNKKRKTKIQLEEFGWLDTDIEYKINKHGFRSIPFDFENENSIIFLGCSYTEGIGINHKDIWCTKVAEALGMDCYNLGFGGGSLDTMYRLAQHWVPKFKSRLVVALEPPGPRYEVFNQALVNMSQLIIKDERIHRLRYAVDYNHLIHLDKTYTAITHICEKSNKKFIGFKTDIWQSSKDKARDLLHPGPDGHTKTAKKMIKFIEGVLDD